ncbi:unnamed protein product, partial [marine sediment metagenome]
ESAHGQDRREVEIESVHIPDLWQVAFNLENMQKELIPTYREMILECWRIAHDLKNNLTGDV